MKNNPLFFKIMDTQPRKGDLRKREILLAAIKIVGREGGGALTYESIGQALGIRRSHVAYHFESLEEIVSLATRFAVATGQEFTVRRMAGAEGRAEMIAAMVDSILDWITEERASAKLFFHSLILSFTQSEYRALHADIREKGALRIVAGLRKFASQPDRGLEDPLYPAARSAQGLLMGLAVDLLAFGDLTPANLRRERKRAIAAMEALLPV
jgi:AcrR family transcriptional regulator